LNYDKFLSTIIIKEEKFVLVFNQLRTTPWRSVGEIRYSSGVLDLGTRLNRDVSFTSAALIPGKEPPVPTE
jgi:hypothetical protein